MSTRSTLHLFGLGPLTLHHYHEGVDDKSYLEIECFPVFGRGFCFEIRLARSGVYPLIEWHWMRRAS